MSQVRPQVALRYGRQNQPIRVPIENQLIDPAAQTYLAANAAVGDTTLTVQNIANFGSTMWILIGDPGNQNSEIFRLNAVPTGTTLTLLSALVNAHSASTPITSLYYDKVQIYNAPTITGTKTQLGSDLVIPPTQLYTEYNDTAVHTGYYFARWENSYATTFSDYSEPSPVTAYTMSSARSIIDSALGTINKTTSQTLTDEYAFQQIDACQMETLREFKRWSFMQAFNTIVGTALTGNWKILLPANCDDQNTYKSLYNFRIGKELDMVWVDKEEWDDLIAGIAYSTLSVAATIGQTSLTLVNSSDFDDTGTIQVGADQYTWTVNTRATGVLTLGSALVSNYALGQDVFQFASLGLPTYWTIWGGYIYHWPAISASYNNRNYYLDYYKSLTQIVSDSDQIVLPDPTVVQYYLAWKFLLKLNNGEETDGSKAQYANYILRREKMKQKESINRNFVLNPDIGDNFYGNIYS